MWQPGITMEQVEQETILKALRYCSGNRTKAADILAISPRTLFSKLKQYREKGVQIEMDQGPVTLEKEHKV